MNPRPTGRVRGNDLVLTRQFRGSLADVWASVTHPDSTARWIGRWEGEPGVGKICRLQMGFEVDSPWVDFAIEACEPPRHVALTTTGSDGLHLELTLVARGDTVELTFLHKLADLALAGDYGPGWEYYLDLLVAARDGGPRPEFTDYDPSQRAYFLGEAVES